MQTDYDFDSIYQSVWNQIAAAHEASEFMRSPLGVAILQRAKDEIGDALSRFLSQPMLTLESARALQQQAQVAWQGLSWLHDIIQSGAQQQELQETAGVD